MLLFGGWVLAADAADGGVDHERTHGNSPQFWVHGADGFILLALLDEPLKQLVDAAGHIKEVFCRLPFSQPATSMKMRRNSGCFSKYCRIIMRE